jgi:putative tryptophan/tyrosine transport system substrate-binding protein
LIVPIAVNALVFVGARTMRRREFIKFLAGAAATQPFAARAQQATAMPVIGFLNGASSGGIPFAMTAFRQGLREAGYVEGQNVAIESRWADNQLDRLPAMIADLIHRQVSVIVAGGTPAALAAKKVATTTPVVFETSADPIQLGLVASLDRPGGNVTGVTQLNVEVAQKRLELLRELLPRARVIALLINPADSVLSDAQMREVLAAARAVGVELPVLKADSERDFDAVFLNLTKLRAEGLVVGVGGLFTSHAEQLAKLAIRHAMPTIYKGREFAAAGGLLSYGSDLAESYQLAGIQAGRILKGDKPADLPVQQATKIELYVNLKTAKAFGINVPLPLSGRADELFE